MPIDRIITASIEDGAVVADDLAAGAVNTQALALFNATGSAPVYACRAWVNFNGTGTVAIRASGNVSSITDGGVGIYTVNLTTAMPDANYSVSCGYTPDVAFTSGAAAARMTFVVSQSTGSFVLNTGFQSNGSAVGVGLLDFPAVNVAIFR